ncbi:uncharacterized protein LOC101208118 [Cucumis sativus]|uniref:Senescence regulator n=1 Tax=Cucumis sativus TaxID=3659 RepID=A0A0A0LX30_CUCSA|nr:uncharacterized protein LOC101208118 [Cucumis sativus]KGN64516.1 hypothetical protein Csa_014243 [Cucumis sativus]
MANWSSALRKNYGFSDDLEEEDVWNSVEGKEDSSNFISRKSSDYYYSSSSSSSSSLSSSSSTWRLPTAPKMIPKSISTRAHETQMANNRSSAPVDIPDWSKIYGKMGSSSTGDKDDVRDQEDGEDEDMVPPHEWIAQKLARSRISSFSVCEGVGRTLKGRDLSKVRNAILTKTGFLE